MPFYPGRLTLTCFSSSTEGGNESVLRMLVTFSPYMETKEGRIKFYKEKNSP